MSSGALVNDVSASGRHGPRPSIYADPLFASKHLGMIVQNEVVCSLLRGEHPRAVYFLKWIIRDFNGVLKRLSSTRCALLGGNLEEC